MLRNSDRPFLHYCIYGAARAVANPGVRQTFIASAIIPVFQKLSGFVPWWNWNVHWTSYFQSDRCTKTRNGEIEIGNEEMETEMEMVVTRVIF